MIKMFVYMSIVVNMMYEMMVMYDLGLKRYFSLSVNWIDCSNIFVNLAVLMRAHMMMDPSE